MERTFAAALRPAEAEGANKLANSLAVVSAVAVEGVVVASRIIAIHACSERVECTSAEASALPAGYPIWAGLADAPHARKAGAARCLEVARCTIIYAGWWRSTICTVLSRLKRIQLQHWTLRHSQILYNHSRTR